MRVNRRTLVLLVGGGLIAGTLVGCHTPTPVLRQRGLDAYRVQDYEAARSNFQQVVHRNPSDWKANYHLGKIALADDKPLTARTYLEAAYTVRNEGPPRHPETFEIVDALAEALYQQGDYPRLIGFTEEVIDHFGRVTDYLRKADYLAQMGDHDAAIVVYKQAIKTGPADDPTPYVALADFYDAIGDREAAVLQLRYAYTIDPGDQAIADRLRAHGVVPGPTVMLEPPR